MIPPNPNILYVTNELRPIVRAFTGREFLDDEWSRFGVFFAVQKIVVQIFLSVYFVTFLFVLIGGVGLRSNLCVQTQINVDFFSCN